MNVGELIEISSPTTLENFGQNEKGLCDEYLPLLEKRERWRKLCSKQRFSIAIIKTFFQKAVCRQGCGSAGA